MPTIIAALLRQVIMALVTSGILTGVQEIFDGTIKQLVFEIKDKEGVTEQTAKDVVRNILADMAINTVSIFLVLKAKLPTKTAQYLGVTSNGIKTKVTTAAAVAVGKKLAVDGGATVTKSAIPKILKIAAIPGSLIWLVSAIANIIEPGIYKPTQTNEVYKKLGIPFKYPETESQLQPGPFDGATFRDYAKALETAGVKGIENPIALQSQPYSRQALADLINYTYGQEVLKGEAPSAKKLIPLLAPFIIGGSTAKTSNTVNIIPNTNTAPVATTTAPQVTKVFSGIVAQGVVRQGLTFTPRPDDIIESLDELREAAANNLAPYLNTLLGKIVYEVKVVSYVITKDGFKQSGTTQRIQSGTFSNGAPKFKTVTNKFATLIVYAITDKGVRAKLTTIVLGPTDSAKLTVGQNDLRTLETMLPKDVTTNNIADIQGVETAPAKKTVIAKINNGGVDDQTDDGIPPAPIYAQASYKGNVLSISDIQRIVGAPQEAKPGVATLNAIDAWQETNGLKQTGVVDQLTMDALNKENKTYTESTDQKDTFVNVSNGNNVSVKPLLQTQQKLGDDARNLSEWYGANGQQLPSIEIRSREYERLGLGQASYYFGTAEQNTKLLQALKLS